MGNTFRHEGIRNVRSSKGVYHGADVTRSALSTLSMTAGRVKFGKTAADITAANGQQLNEGGDQANVLSATFSTAALADGGYQLYLKTDGTLDVVGEAGTPLSKGPLVTLNNTGAPTSPNIQTLDTPSIRLCSFQVVSFDVPAASINYDSRETVS